jgi:hypothetical protein
MILGYVGVKYSSLMNNGIPGIRSSEIEFLKYVIKNVAINV